jgi:hypothetical protein
MQFAIGELAGRVARVVRSDLDREHWKPLLALCGACQVARLPRKMRAARATD